mmetsp:Transcript_5944/g.16410  ORF Transcript_5944/g.16410 Transcript_5944/m.16410 type:complete len:288 (+) Transcript_5944:265-1128(+)
MFGPPAIGSIKAKDAAKHTTKRSCTGSYPFICAVAAMMEPKIESVAMLDTTSVTKQITKATSKMKPNSPVAIVERFSATQAARPEVTVPCAIMAPPPKTKRISHWNLCLTWFQSRILCGSWPPGVLVRQRSWPIRLLTAGGSLAPQGKKKSGNVIARPIEPLSSSRATYFFQPSKLSIGELVNHRTMRIERFAATTISSYDIFPISCCKLRKISRLTGIVALLLQTKTRQKPAHTKTSKIADKGIAQRKNFAKENSPSVGQKEAKASIKMPFVGVPTGVAMPPMVAL